MKAESIKEKIKEFGRKVGKRNFIIFGAVILIVAAVAVNVVIFAKDKDDGFDYDQSAGMSGGSVVDTGSVADTDVSADEDAYFSGVQVSRQRTRDEAIEVLQSVVDNASSTETAKNEALAEINKLATIMATEANIETLIVAKGFEECVAVISGEDASIVVKSDGLSVAQISQINEIVYSEAGILPVNITIIER
ncbi:MAG: SpoIIIAH-like family protein [Ruminococcaceae bacterium]|nr:SpoIIIAH-like family protein [Oscillospiraceae bacterium]